MSNTNQVPNKGKEKLNEKPGANLKTMVNRNKRKAIVLEEEPKDGAQFSPFLIFGFIIDPTKGYQKAYSCNFCNLKFVSPQPLSENQNFRSCEGSFNKIIEALDKVSESLYRGIQEINLNNIIPYNEGYGHQYAGFDAGDFQGSLMNSPQMDQETVSQEATMTEIDFGLVLKEASKNVDLNLKL